jgi:hypothetical protein
MWAVGECLTTTFLLGTSQSTADTPAILVRMRVTAVLQPSQVIPTLSSTLLAGALPSEAAADDIAVRQMREGLQHETGHTHSTHTAQIRSGDGKGRRAIESVDQWWTTTSECRNSELATIAADTTSG